MYKIPDKPALLLLEDGRVFYGKAAGAIGTTTGNIVFHTGMTGHQKTFSDPANKGLILVMATTHVGNTGIKQDDLESGRISLEGLVVKSFSDYDNRSNGGISLNSFLSQQNIVAIRDVDTRAVIRHIRDHGSMKAVISSEETNPERLKSLLDNHDEMDVFADVYNDSDIHKEDSNGFKIAIVNSEVKRSLLDQLMNRNCTLRIFPLTSTFEEIANWNPDGYLIPNSAGNPNSYDFCNELIKKIIDSKKPVFGTGLGMVLLAKAIGIQSMKAKNIHHGLNHSVKNLQSGTAEITAQNFEYIPNPNDLKNHSAIEITHLNINDQVIAGFKFKELPVFAVQYNPESSPGPHDSFYHFDYFMELIKETKNTLTH